MADVNEKYKGYVPTGSVDDALRSIYRLLGQPESFIQVAINSPEAAELRTNLDKAKAEAIASIEAVKTPYSGKTTADRVTWINSILLAIDTRLRLIRQLTNSVIDRIRSRNAGAANTAFSIITGVFSLVPVVGTISAVTIQADKAKHDALAKLEAEDQIALYADDVNQLKKIRDTLAAELNSLTGTSKEPTNNAPTPLSTWLIIGAGALLLFFLFVSKRR